MTNTNESSSQTKQYNIEFYMPRIGNVGNNQPVLTSFEPSTLKVETTID